LVNLRRRAQRWTMDNVATLKTAVPELPAGFDNRLGDNWRLMLAIADLAGGEWPGQARQAATAVAKITDAGMSVGVKLLADIRDIFASKAVRRIPSAELVEALVEIEGHPWADWKGGKPITKNALALLLAPFPIVSVNIRVGDRVVKGYQVAQFQDAFERYL
jgi:putative DNA primase/helicase